MESIASVLAVFLLLCLSVIATAIAAMCCFLVWDESCKILRHRSQRRAMDRSLKEMAAADPSNLD